jgi:hypothetical protein
MKADYRVDSRKDHKRLLERGAQSGKSLAVLAHALGCDSTDVRLRLKDAGLYDTWKVKRAALKAARCKRESAA